jgi:hypothetical protein
VSKARTDWEKVLEQYRAEVDPEAFTALEVARWALERGLVDPAPLPTLTRSLTAALARARVEVAPGRYVRKYFSVKRPRAGAEQ